ncbi:hypothetical protein AVEN_139489-1 [Araneus ventricosus]|uniref:Uncharacterized protein n=1 Tax=Araneus ventricosus TaxID=182803 RepID=A0A4Y2USR8_ARAVE|nr:hypothetical protein AVEN_139489-1 [Araneus ventricosus]
MRDKDSFHRAHVHSFVETEAPVPQNASLTSSFGCGEQGSPSSTECPITALLDAGRARKPQFHRMPNTSFPLDGEQASPSSQNANYSVLLDAAAKEADSTECPIISSFHLKKLAPIHEGLWWLRVMTSTLS